MNSQRFDTIANGNKTLPPDQLAKRVGGTTGERFIFQGREIKKCILHSLPESFDFRNKRILDYGCGVGRALIHFDNETEHAHFYGCDIHEPSVNYLAQNTTRFHLFKNEEEPPLPFLDNYFDMIYCISVFTHLVDTWEEWVKELHRILKPNGIAVVTFLYQTAYERTIKRPFSEKNNGMSVFFKDRPWDKGGPNVYHSNWWIIENWGKYFVIDNIFEEGLMNWQSIALLTKNDDKLYLSKHQTKVIRPYLFKTFVEGFSGNLEYDKFPGESWHKQHGKTVKNRLDIPGWFASQHGTIEKLECRIDDKKVPFQLEKTERKDVVNRFKSFSDSGILGFIAKFDVANCKKGFHDLSVSATDSKGNEKQIRMRFYKAG